MKIIVDDLSSEEIVMFLEEHIEEMKTTSPPESKHALEINELRKPEISFWSVYKLDQLVGCGALKHMSILSGEIKSMRTTLESRGNGVASHLLQHILKVALERGYNKVSLETGSMSFFKPARRLYSKFGEVPRVFCKERKKCTRSLRNVTKRYISFEQ